MLVFPQGHCFEGVSCLMSFRESMRRKDMPL